MGNPLRILLVEDSALHAQLLLRELRRGGYVLVSRRVETPAELQAALAERWDVALVDYVLPGWGGPEALALLGERAPELPCLIVSSEIDEDTAVAAMQAGARDFVMKDNLRRLVPAITREVGAAAGRRAGRRAEQALHERDAFLSMAAHELRTPVATLLAHADLLRETAAQCLDSEQASSLEVIERQALRLRRLVGELVDAARLRLGHLELHRRRVELGLLAAEALAELRPIGQGHRLVLEREGPVWVEADGYRIEQVLLNLLSNAIKFSPAGGQIVLQVGVLRRHAVVSVRDEGIGIPAERQVGLFERFARAHADTEHDRGGLGLGLFISREFVERHGGRIWCQSAVGRGATFSFSLPLAEEGEHGGGTRPQLERAGGGG